MLRRAEIWGTHHEGGDAEGGAAKGLNAGIDQEVGLDGFPSVLELCVFPRVFSRARMTH